VQEAIALTKSPKHVQPNTGYEQMSSVWESFHFWQYVVMTGGRIIFVALFIFLWGF